jgi:hypothetical protein
MSTNRYSLTTSLKKPIIAITIGLTLIPTTQTPNEHSFHLYNDSSRSPRHQVLFTPHQHEPKLTKIDMKIEWY